MVESAHSDKSKNSRVSDQAYTVIKRAILEGRLKPGEKLKKREMASLCGVSIIPVIDALSRLESEGLVESNPYTGSRVVCINDQWMTDLFILREAVEVQIVRILCYTIGLPEAEALRSMAQKIDQAAGCPDKYPEYDELHYEFHFRMARETGSKGLVNEMEHLQLFTLLSKSEQNYTSLDSSLISQQYSHEDIITAILKRSPDEAQAIMRNHIYRSRVIEKPYWV
ncbi:MAG: GntR family transcriptional regulator [Treponema sp.]|jgi:DNA-binding GntR family transcriptional regulator|nr:GntR family transcriptional regulator [Treponema sp.]